MYIDISIDQMKVAVNQMTLLEKKLNNELHRLDAARAVIDKFESESWRDNYRAVKICYVRLEEEIKKIKRLRVGLEKIIQLYEDNDEKVAEFEAGLANRRKLKDVIINSFFVEAALVKDISLLFDHS